MNPNGDKGTRAETTIARHLQASGFPHAERRARRGRHDTGDITGIPDVVIEVKNRQRMELAAWVDEACREAVNARAGLGVVWHKRRGKTDPGSWFVTMTGAQFTALLRDRVNGDAQ